MVINKVYYWFVGLVWWYWESLIIFGVCLVCFCGGRIDGEEEEDDDVIVGDVERMGGGIVEGDVWVIVIEEEVIVFVFVGVFFRSWVVFMRFCIFIVGGVVGVLGVVGFGVCGSRFWKLVVFLFFRFIFWDLRWFFY